jgi:preprotein translocase subunit YajC
MVFIERFWAFSPLLLAQEGEGDFLTNLFLNPLVPFVLIGVLFYMMLIRPERRKRAEHGEMLKNLKKNDRVVTIGGIFGTVVNVPKDSEDVTLRIDEGNNTRIRVLRSAISRVLPSESPGAKSKLETKESGTA